MNKVELSKQFFHSTFVNRRQSTMPSPREEQRGAAAELQYATVAVQVDPDGALLTEEEIAQCERDEIVPWDAPSLQAPLCSWGALPPEPSPELRMLVEIFSN